MTKLQEALNEVQKAHIKEVDEMNAQLERQRERTEELSEAVSFNKYTRKLVVDNSSTLPSHSHPDDHTIRTTDTPEFKIYLDKIMKHTALYALLYSRKESPTLKCA